MLRIFFHSLLTLTLSFGSSPLYASTYDDDVIDIYAKIIPRLILMSNEKAKYNERVEICVLHDKMDERSALSLTEKISAEYPSGIKNLKIKMTSTAYSNMDICENSQMLFLFNSSDSNIEKAAKFSNEHKVMSMSYDAKYLENGVALSLFLGRKVVPYINMNSFRKTGIELDNVLLRISKIYSEDGK